MMVVKRGGGGRGLSSRRGTVKMHMTSTLAPKKEHPTSCGSHLMMAMVLSHLGSLLVGS